MKSGISMRVSVAFLAMLACADLAPMAIAAKVRPPRFEEIESDYNNDYRLLNAKKVLHTAIPAGMAVADAQAILERAGAKCDAEPQASMINCIYRDEIVVDEYYTGDVTWTVTLLTQAGLVTGMTIERNLNKH